MEAEKIAELKQFVVRCKSDPSILHDPALGFFKSYLESFGARIPKDIKPAKSGEDMMESEDHTDVKNPNLSNDDILNEDIAESDVELDSTDVVEPDNDPPQKMGDPSSEVTEGNQDAAQLAKSKAMDAMCEGNLLKALDHLTEAIMLNPSSGMLYATRGSVFVKLKKPNAAIRDADTALQVNPDLAKGYKIRGIARAMLGLWEEAAHDLHDASKIDYDDEIGLILKKVEPNAYKIQEHRRKYERLRRERELKKTNRDRERRRAEAQAAYERDEEPSENKPFDPAAAASKDGHVIGIHSFTELETKLSAVSRTSGLAILYFTATWCGPCRFMSPLYTTMAGKYTKVVFLKVDIDDAKDVAAQWNISSVPTFFFIRNGKEIDKVVGADKSSLERKIAQYSG